MSNLSLGNLEETILLLVLVLRDDAYGVSVAEEYQRRYNKSISIPAIHTVLGRLEKKALVTSRMGGATAERGGRKKRLFEVTRYGYKVLCDLRDARAQLWDMAPNLTFQ